MVERIAPAPPRVEEQEKQLLERRDRFDVSELSLPPGANVEEDILIDATETYQEFKIPETGERYRLSYDPDQRPLGERAREGAVSVGKAAVEYIKDPSLPSSEQIGKVAKSIEEQTQEALFGGKATLGDVASFAAGSGVAGQFGKAPAGALRSFTGNTYLSDSGAPPNTLKNFRNPLKETLLSMPIPNKGIKGSELLKKLESNPEIRGPLISASDLQERVDPGKRYSKDELERLAEETGYTTRTTSQGKAFSQYQRQDEVGFTDSEIDYEVLTVESAPSNKSKAREFKPKQGHFSGYTIAHARVSEREPVGGGETYLLVEELQSDLLQQGYQKPQKAVSLKEVVSKKTPKEDLTNLFVNSLSEGKLQEFIDIVEDPVDRELRLDRLLTFFDNNEKIFGNEVLNKLEKTGALKNADQLGAILNNVGFNLSMFSRQTKSFGAPPIKKTKEGVDVSLKSILQNAENRDIDRIVFPPFEKIVEARFPKSTPEYEKMIEDGSPFYRTYVTALNQSLEELKENYPVSVKKVEIPYQGSKLGSMQVQKVLEELPKKEVTEILGISTDVTEQTLKSFLEGIGGTPEVAQRFIPELQKRGHIPSDKEVLEGVEIDISEARKQYDLSRPRFAEGGVVEKQMNKLFKEGGMADDGMDKDPVSGNEIPPGSTAKEVRDDVDVKLSEGEYVVPADVVQYYGVKFFEDLREKAKDNLEEMDEDGRIGGEPVEDNDDLTEEEMSMLQEALMSDPQGMAMGGIVRQPQQQVDPYAQQRMMYQQPMGMQEGGVVARPSVPGMPYGNPTLQQMFTPYGASQPAFVPGVPAGGAIEYRQYINSNTGEIRQFAFSGDQPVTPIPEGFEPYTREAAEKAQQAQQTVVTEGTRRLEEGDGRAGPPTQTTSEDPKRSFDPLSDVDFSDPKSVKEWAEGKAEKSLLEKGVAGAGLALGSPLIGGAASAALETNDLAQVRAASQMASYLGREELADELDGVAEGMQGSLGRLPSFLAKDQIAQGDNYFKSALEARLDPSVGGGLDRSQFGSDERFDEVMQEVAPEGMTYQPSEERYVRQDDGDGRAGTSAPETSIRPKPRPTARPTAKSSTSSSGTTTTASSSGGARTYSDGTTNVNPNTGRVSSDPNARFNDTGQVAGTGWSGRSEDRQPSGGSGGGDSGGGGGGSGGGCVVATHAVSTGAFTPDDKQRAVDWCRKNLHGNWFGETFRKGYRRLGNKHIDNGTVKNYYTEFEDYVNFVTGKKRNLKGLLTFLYRTPQLFVLGLFTREK